MSETSGTRSIYIDHELWERIEKLSKRLDLSKSQIIENMLKHQIGKIEACVEQSEGMGILLCQTCTTR